MLLVDDWYYTHLKSLVNNYLILDYSISLWHNYPTETTRVQIMSLIKLLQKADGINIDDHFFRYFELEDVGADEAEEIILDISIEEDGNRYDYVFSRADLEAATQNDDGSWTAPSSGEMNLDAEITPCAVSVLKYAP